MSKMSYKDAADYIKEHPLESGLIKPAPHSKTYICPICHSGEGAHGTGMEVYDFNHPVVFTCFAHQCFKNPGMKQGGTLLDIVAALHNIPNDKTHFKDIVTKAAEYFHIEIDESAERKTSIDTRKFKKAAAPAPKKQERPRIDFTAFINEAHQRINEPPAREYLSKRGISPTIADAFNLGYAICKGRPLLIIPMDNGSYAGRAMDGREPRYSNGKFGGTALTHGRALYEDEPCYIVEGAIDAMSFYEAGTHATALNSASNYNLIIQAAKESRPTAPLIIALDNDDTGRKDAQALMKEMAALHIDFAVADTAELYGGASDANNALLQDAEGFKARIKDATEAALAEIEQKRAARADAEKKKDVETPLDADAGAEIPPDASGNADKLTQARQVIDDALAESENKIFPILSNDEVLAALVLLQDAYNEKFAEVEDLGRAQKQLNPLRKAVKAFRIKQQKPASTRKLSLLDGEGHEREFIEPPNFILNEHGIVFKKNNIQHILISTTPTIIDKLYVDADTNNNKYAVSIYRKGRITTVIRDAAVIMDAKKVIALANNGLNISSNSAKRMTQFYQEFEGLNTSIIPIETIYSVTGWHRRENKDIFVIPPEYRLATDNNDDFAKWYEPKGDVDEWSKTARIIRKNPIARFTLAASAAAPFLNLFNERSFTIYLHGNSRAGKTAAMKFAASVWSDAGALMNGNTTVNAIEARLGTVSDMPFFLDEMQALKLRGKKREEFFSNLIYMNAEGQGRGRMNRDATARKLKTWRTIAILSGEESMLSYNSLPGEQARMIDLEIREPIIDEKLAREIHSTIAREQHGTMGRKLIEYLIKHGSELIVTYKNFCDALQDKYTERNTAHICHVAIVAIADYIISHLLGEDGRAARDESMELAYTICDTLPTLEEMDTTANALEFIYSWVDENEGFFEDEKTPIEEGLCETQPPRNRQMYGFKKEGCFCIYPNEIENALNDAGFSARTVMSDLAHRGILKPGTKGKGKITPTRQERHNGKRPRVYVLPIRKAY